MTIRIEAVHFTADEKLKSLIEEKLAKLQKIFDRITSIDVYLKLENSGQVKDKIVELKANLPGAVLFSEDKEKSFEAALDGSCENMRRQVKKYKDKNRAKAS